MEKNPLNLKYQVGAIVCTYYQTLQKFEDCKRVADCVQKQMGNACNKCCNV